MNKLVADERGKAIDITSAPLCRFTYIKYSRDKSKLLWSVHHLLADGLSTPTILVDVLSAYSDDRTDNGQSTPYQYSQFISWLSCQDTLAATTYWKEMLSGVTPTPTKLIVSENNSNGRSNSESIPQVQFALTSEQTRQFETFCQTHKVTLSTFLHAAWALLLREYSGCISSLFASTVSGRHADVAGMEQAVGLYLNAQPRLIRTNSEISLVSWMHEVQSGIHESAHFDHTSLSTIQEYIDADKNEQVFESIVTIGGHPSELDISADRYDVAFTNIHYQSTQSHYPLAFLAFPGSNLDMSLVYDDSKYSPCDIANMSEFMLSTIETMMLSCDISPKEVTKKIAIARARALHDRNRSTVLCEFNTVHDWFESVVNKTPDSTAILYGDESITFAELDLLTNRIANHIQDKADFESTAPIGLMLTRSVEQIATMLAVLKAGFAYVPIDPDYPTSAIEQYIQIAQIRLVVSTSDLSGTITNGLVEEILVEESKEYPATRIKHNVVGSDNLAYVMFTSGSTGVPKGVQITHGNLLYCSVAGIYWCLCGGGTLILPYPEEEKDIQRIAKLFAKQGATHTLCLPSYYQLLLENTDHRSYDSLQVVIVAGEPLPRDLVIRHWQDRPASMLFNEYGPTETCVWSTVHRLNEVPRSTVSIGKAIGTSDVQVINDHGNPCPSGVSGEIVISGPGVSPGYINDPLLSAEKFTQLESGVEANAIYYKTGDLGYVNTQGDIQFLGRIDRQLKIRGHRIEPGTVEETLNSHEHIAQTAVVGLKHSDLNEYAQIRMPIDAVKFVNRNNVSENDVAVSRSEILAKLNEHFSEHDIRSAIAELNLYPSVQQAVLEAEE